MNVGELRYRITFQKMNDTTTNDNGFPLSDSEKWTDYITVWGAASPLKGSEFWSAMAVHYENTFKFMCRYNSSINSKMRIKYNDRKFEITGVIDVDERHKWLQIYASEVI
jgi:SPP1 family predicted phage head-tail adaptor